MDDKWVNIEDAAEYLSVSIDTIRTWIKEEKLPAYKVGKRYKLKLSEIDQEQIKSSDFERILGLMN